jgi:hypothetical protein
VPQLLWKDYFQKEFEIFFPSVYDFSARRFCATALVKLCGNFSWAQAAAELRLPTESSVKMANRCMTILKKNGTKDLFARKLRKVSEGLSNDSNKIDYGARRKFLSTFTYISAKNWDGICRAGNIFPGYDSRNRYAAVWLWAELTGGDWRLAPGIEEKNRDSFRDVYRVLSKTMIPKLAPRLRAYGEILLQEIE